MESIDLSTALTHFVQLLGWMSVHLAAQPAKEELSCPEKWLQLIKNYFLRKSPLFSVLQSYSFEKQI